MMSFAFFIPNIEEKAMCGRALRADRCDCTRYWYCTCSEVGKSRSKGMTRESNYDGAAYLSEIGGCEFGSSNIGGGSSTFLGSRDKDFARFLLLSDWPG